MKKLRIDIWSDIACPWCYVGKRRLEAALKQFAHAADVDVTWRAFELDPSAPAIRHDSLSTAERLAKKYGMSVAQAKAATDNLTRIAAGDGLDLHLDKIQGGSTFDAHRVLHFAHERGLQDAVKERFFRAYMTEGVVLGDRETIASLAAEAGLGRDEVVQVLASERYAADVRADEDHATKLGISGVPFFVLGGRFGISGAQPVAVLLAALEKAWNAVHPEVAAVAEGAVCGPDGCA